MAISWPPPIGSCRAPPEGHVTRSPSSGPPGWTRLSTQCHCRTNTPNRPPESALGFERLVAYLAGPGCGADRLADPAAMPGVPLARVGPVPVEEGCLQAGAAAEVLGGEPRKVGQGGT